MPRSHILVIGGTGAQGAAVVKHLVKDGAYSVRVLTRDIQIYYFIILRPV